MPRTGYLSPRNDFMSGMRRPDDNDRHTPRPPPRPVTGPIPNNIPLPVPGADSDLPHAIPGVPQDWQPSLPPDSLFRPTRTNNTAAVNDDFLKYYDEFAKTGGLDRSRYADSLGWYDEFARTGGLDRSRYDKTLGYYDEYADTGGVSDRDRGLFRARSMSSLPALSNLLRTRDARFSGGANAARIGKDFARLRGGQALDTETSLLDRIQQGRQFGIKGGADTRFGLDDRETAGRQFGIQGGSNLRLNLDQLEQQGRQFGTTGRTTTQFGLGDRRAGIAQGNRDSRLSALGIGTGLYSTGNRQAQNLGNAGSLLGSKAGTLIGGANSLAGNPTSMDKWGGVLDRFFGGLGGLFGGQ